MRILTLVLASLAVAPLALAQTANFTAIDANADGQLTMEEVAAFYPDATQEAFAKADSDGSGGLSAEEYAASQMGQ